MSAVHAIYGLWVVCGIVFLGGAASESFRAILAALSFGFAGVVLLVVLELAR